MQKDNINIQIDELLQTRKRAVFDYSESNKKLTQLGVKFGHASSGEIEVPENFAPYLDKFEISEREFEWEIAYTDGSVLRQFEGEEEHCFKDIDLTRIKSVAYVSNFDWPCDNRERRVIVRLNWETEIFEITNGFISQEDLENLTTKEDGDEGKKLILFARRRHDIAVGNGENSDELIQMMDEVIYYNRFILGYEANGKKKAVVIHPNGEIKIFN